MTQDIIRVLRLYSFEGPRDVVERQLAGSLRDGTNDRPAYTGAQGFQRGGEVTIKVATLGTFPEIMEPVKPPAQGEFKGWAEFDGEEWFFYQAGSETAEHITNFQKAAHGVSVFPIYANLSPPE